MQYGYGGYGWSGHNAKNDGYPKSYAEAKAYLQAANRGKGADSRKLPGVETQVIMLPKYHYDPNAEAEGRYPFTEAEPAYAVQYHATSIITWYADGSLELRTGGWDTPTTAIKMQACLPDGIRVSSFQSILRVYGAKVQSILPDDAKLPRRREGERYPMANGYKVTLTEEEWAADLTKRREAAERHAQWEAERAAERQKYIDDAVLPHVGQVWQHRAPRPDEDRWIRPSELALESGILPNREAATAWAQREIENLLGGARAWDAITPYWIRTLQPEQAAQERAAREVKAAEQLAS